MDPYVAKLDTKISNDQELHVDTRHIQKNKKPLFFLVPLKSTMIMLATI